MTPPADSNAKEAANARPLDFHRWLVSRGMNPNRRRPLGRTAALLMDYRAYLEREVGRDKVNFWFDKYAGKLTADAPAAAKTS
jgi:hypothetical protein